MSSTNNNEQYFTNDKTPSQMENAAQRNYIPSTWDQDSQINMQPSYPTQGQQSIYTNIPLQNSVQASILTEERIKTMILSLEKVQTNQVTMRQNVDKLSKTMQQMGNGFLVVTLLSWVFYWYIS